MLAAYAARIGGDDPVANLEVGELPDPAPRPGWALVRVRAATLNHHDLWTLRGVGPRPIVPPQILGCDAAGTVEAYHGEPEDGRPALGSRVVVHSVVACGQCAACAAGEPEQCRRVGVFSDAPLSGTLAQLLETPVENLIPLPDSVDFAAAACLPTAYLTAYHALYASTRLTPGDTLLVQGAAGGVATAAMLLARASGIRFLVTSRDAGKRRFAEELGAAATFEPNRDAAKQIFAATSGRGVDAVLDTVGEPTWDLSLRAVRRDGTVVVAGSTGGPNPPAQLNRIFWFRITIAGTSMGSAEELRRLVAMCAQGTLRPLIGSVHTLEDAGEAMSRLVAGETWGKIVIEP